MSGCGTGRCRFWGGVRCGRRLLYDLGCFAGGKRIIFGEYVEIHIGRAVGSLKVGLVAAGSLKRFAGQPGLKETPGVLEVAHQIDGPVPLPINPQPDGDGAELIDRWGDVQYLNAGWEHGFQIHHHCRPGKCLLCEELVQKRGLVENGGVLRLAHHGLIATLLALQAIDLVFYGLQPGVGRSSFRLFVAKQEPASECALRKF